jgi:hypothetical protein
MNPATTFTILSNASVRIATECVKYQAKSFIRNKATDITAMYFWILKF